MQEKHSAFTAMRSFLPATGLALATAAAPLHWSPTTVGLWRKSLSWKHATNVGAQSVLKAAGNLLTGSDGSGDFLLAGGERLYLWESNWQEYE
jgi:hypothetical protein